MFKLENSDLSDEGCPTFSLSELSNFSYALEENSDMLELEKADFSDEKVQLFLVSRLPNFLAFFEKRNSVSSFYFPIDLLLITVDDINKIRKEKIWKCRT